MDALLWELLSEGSPDDIVQVLVRLTEVDRTSFPRLRILAQIGDIASCRIRRGDIPEVRNLNMVFSMKARKVLYLDPPLDEHLHYLPGDSEKETNLKPRPDLPFTGMEVFIGIADWGFDFTHKNFLNADGTTRFHSIWDQGAPYDGVNSYEYG